LHTVIRQDVDFQRLWQQATSRQASPPPPPTIDFGQEMVIAVGAGRLTSDDRIQVDSVGVSEEMNPGGRSEETLNVFVSVVLACQRFDIEGFPLEVVRLRRFDGPVRFHDQRRQAENCLRAPGPGGS
jgi:hypothetical protein